VTGYEVSELSATVGKAESEGGAVLVKSYMAAGREARSCSFQAATSPRFCSLAQVNVAVRLASLRCWGRIVAFDRWRRLPKTRIARDGFAHPSDDRA